MPPLVDLSGKDNLGLGGVAGFQLTGKLDRIEHLGMAHQGDDRQQGERHDSSHLLISFPLTIGYGFKTAFCIITPESC
jgi:hypothetical protein